MNNFTSALWAETLKARRSKMPFFTGLGFTLVPLVAGLTMIILKDPEAAKSMGLISAKAQMMVGVADWPTFFSVISQAIAVGGGILFAIITAWVFGREFSDRTVKELLALPTSRETIVAAKYVLITAWAFALSTYIFGAALLIGYLVVMPGWSIKLLESSFVDTLGTASLTIALAPFVALFAGIGRGYLPAIGWAIFTVVLSQVSVITGWGDWFPWSVSALYSGMAGPRSGLLGLHSYVVLILTALIGLTATFFWWRRADQTR